MTEISERTRATFKFFNQLREPEKSQAIENFDEGYSECIPKDLISALFYGFNVMESHKWITIYQQLNDGSYFTTPFSIEELAEEEYVISEKDKYDTFEISMMDLQRERKEAFIYCYNKLKELGKIKE